MGRINSWHVAWETAKHYFFGGGMSYQHEFLFQQYGPYENTVRAAHSIYFEILGNHGFIGLFLYLMLGVSTYRAAAWLRKNAREIPQAKWAADLGAMAQVSLVGFAVGGAFLSLSYFDLPYDIMVMVVLAKKWVETRAWETEPEVSFREALGFGRKVPLLELRGRSAPLSGNGKTNDSVGTRLRRGPTP
jgi:probable O-glycosylation ligase (exosortase A-associated)